MLSRRSDAGCTRIEERPVVWSRKWKPAALSHCIALLRCWAGGLGLVAGVVAERRLGTCCDRRSHDAVVIAPSGALATLALWGRALRRGAAGLRHAAANVCLRL